jgi:hypothetical protein
VIKINCEKESIIFSEKTVSLRSSMYIINQIESNLTLLEKNFLVDGGLHMRNVWVELRNRDGDSKRITLFGTLTTLKEVKKNDFLAIPNKNE